MLSLCSKNCLGFVVNVDIVGLATSSNFERLCVQHKNRLVKEQLKKKKKARGKAVLPNICRMQAAISVHSRHPPPPGYDAMVLSAAGWMMSFAAYSARLTMHCQWRWRSSCPIYVHGDLDLWPWHWNSSEWGTKHVCHVNLMQIRSAVPDIFESQTNKQN